MPSGHILVADDDAGIRTVLNQALTRAGYEVRSTGTVAGLWRWVAAGEGDHLLEVGGGGQEAATVGGVGQ